MGSEEKTTYTTLDGLRGVAAISVLVHHLIVYFFPERGNLFHGNLAVDFFFVLSGFVIAHAYADKLASGDLSFRDFAVVRIRRLLPLAWLGVALGAIAWMIYPSGEGGRLGFLPLLPWALILTPKPLTDGYVFPLNGAMWTLSVEIWSNVIFAALIHRASTRNLLITAALGLIGSAYATICCDGYMYGHTNQTFFYGFARMAFGFPVGVLIYRHRRLLAQRFGVTKAARGMSPLALSLLLVLAFASVSLIPQGLPQALFELALVSLGLPCMVILGAGVSATPASAKPMKALGAISYPLYATHIPILLLASEVGHGFGAMAAAGVSAVVVAGLAQTRFEPWVRKLMRPRQGVPVGGDVPAA
eukprot:gene16342-16519_t